MYKARIRSGIIDGESHCKPAVIQPRDLRLCATGNVFGGEVALLVRRYNCVAVVRDGAHPVTEVAGNGTGIIDPEQLIEIGIGVVVDRLKIVAGSLGQCWC